MRKRVLAVSLALVLLAVMGAGACGGGDVTPPLGEEEEEAPPAGEEEEAPPAGEEEEEAPPEAVTFPDGNLEAAVRDELGKAVGEEITTAELAKLTTLTAESNGITDLSGLEYCTSLTVLDLWANKISDISPLEKLNSLAVLYLDENQISDISPLENLTSLTVLYLWGNQISDISPLSNITSLTKLYLIENPISDVSPLVENSGLGAGDEVWLGGNNLDLSEGSEDMENIRALEDRGVTVHY